MQVLFGFCLWVSFQNRFQVRFSVSISCFKINSGFKIQVSCFRYYIPGLGVRFRVSDMSKAHNFRISFPHPSVPTFTFPSSKNLRRSISPPPSSPTLSPTERRRRWGLILTSLTPTTYLHPSHPIPSHRILVESVYLFRAEVFLRGNSKGCKK